MGPVDVRFVRESEGVRVRKESASRYIVPAMAKKDPWEMFEVAPSAREATRAPGARDGLTEVAELVAEERITDARSKAMLHHLGVQKMSRPIAASVAAVVFGIGAAFALVAVAVLPFLVLASATSLSIGLILAACVICLIIARFNWRAMRGMWQGTPEGWVIGVAIMSTALIAALFSLVRVQMGTLPATSAGAISPLWKYSIRALLAGAMLASLMAPSVRGYCGLFMKGSTSAVLRRLAPYLLLVVIVQVLLLFL